MSLTNFIALPLPAELEILEILWCRSSLTAREIHGVLAVRRSISYRTVKTILTLMQAKGLLDAHVLQMPIIYQATLTKADFQRLALSQIASTFFYGDMSNLLCAVLTHPELQRNSQQARDRALQNKSLS